MSNSVYLNIDGNIVNLDLQGNAISEASSLIGRGGFPIYDNEQDAISAGNAYDNLNDFDKYEWGNKRDRLIAKTGSDIQLWIIILLFDYLCSQQ